MKTGSIIVLLFFVTSCTRTSKVPSDIFPKEKMEKVLWDMILADRFSAEYILKDSAKKNVKLETMKLYQQVFQLNNTTQADFVKSYKYYLNRPDITRTMFDSLSARGNRDRNTLFKNMQ